VIAWLGGSGGGQRDFREAIAAAGASEVFTVGQQRLTGGQGNLFLCPVDLVSDAVGDEELVLAWQAHGADGANAKIGIVRRDDRISMNRGPQLLRGFYAARDDRVGIDGTEGRRVGW